MKRIQIVARIPADLRRQMGRASKRDRVTLNSIIENALGRYLAGSRRAPENAAVTPKETK